MEDHINWVDQSKIKRKVMEYKGEVDDYDIYEWFNFFSQIKFWIYSTLLKNLETITVKFDRILN